MGGIQIMALALLIHKPLCDTAQSTIVPLGWHRHHQMVKGHVKDPSIVFSYIVYMLLAAIFLEQLVDDVINITPIVTFTTHDFFRVLK